MLKEYGESDGKRGSLLPPESINQFPLDKSMSMLNCLGKNPNHCPHDEHAPQASAKDQVSSSGKMPEALPSQGGALS